VKSWLLATFVLLALCGGCSKKKPVEARPSAVTSQSPTLQDKAEAAWGEGNRAATRGDFWGAIAQYDKAIGLDPDLAELYVARGSAYVAQQNYNHAFADYLTAIDRDPQLASAYYARASLYWLLGELDDAERDYATLVRLRPDDVFFAGLYARVLYDQGKGPEMENFYRGVLRGHPEREWAAFGLLDAVQNNAGISAAITEGEKLYASGIRGPGVRGFIGNAYFQNKNNDEAVKWLRPLLEQDANEVSLESIATLARALANTHDTAGCVDVIRAYRERDGRPSAFDATSEQIRCQNWESEVASADVSANTEGTQG